MNIKQLNQYLSNVYLYTLLYILIQLGSAGGAEIALISNL